MYIVKLGELNVKEIQQRKNIPEGIISPRRLKFICKEGLIDILGDEIVIIVIHMSKNAFLWLSKCGPQWSERVQTII